MRCDEQICLCCGVRNHFLDFAATGVCNECAPVEIVARIEVLATRAPQLRDYDQVEELEPTAEMPAANEWLERVA